MIILTVCDGFIESSWMLRQEVWPNHKEWMNAVKKKANWHKLIRVLELSFSVANSQKINDNDKWDFNFRSASISILILCVYFLHVNIFFLCCCCYGLGRCGRACVLKSIHPPALTNGEPTDSSIETDKYSIAGDGDKSRSRGSSRSRDAATDVSGSSSLRTSGNNMQTKRRKNSNSRSATTRKPSFDAIDDYDVDEYSHGVLITEPHPIPPPFEGSSFRVIGGVRVPGIESEIYGSRKHGERHDVDDWKTWDRFDSKTHDAHHVGTNYASVMHPEGDLMQMPSNDDTDTEDRQDDQPCTLGCLNSEFLCGHSCQCVPKFTRCNGELNCEYGEDEEECGGKWTDYPRIYLI